MRWLEQYMPDKDGFLSFKEWVAANPEVRAEEQLLGLDRAPTEPE